MTRLTIAEDPGEEFTVRGHNIVIDADDRLVKIVFAQRGHQTGRMCYLNE